MKMHAVSLLALSVIVTLPLTAVAQSQPQIGSYSAGGARQAKQPAGLMYECSICHHQVTAAQAKALHYVCPVDHGKLIPVKATVPQRPKS